MSCCWWVLVIFSKHDVNMKVHVHVTDLLMLNCRCTHMHLRVDDCVL